MKKATVFILSLVVIITTFVVVRQWHIDSLSDKIANVKKDSTNTALAYESERKKELETKEYMRREDSFRHSPLGIRQHKKDSIEQIYARKVFIADSIKQSKEEIKIGKIINKYNCTRDQAEGILEHSVSIGMTKEMCIGAWGKPYQINTTTAEGYELEQWVYGLQSYLYFDRSGLLKTIQNSR